MGEINLIKIDGKPLQKLIEVIRDGIGTLYRPRAIRKEADAEAYKIGVIEKAKSKAFVDGKEIEAESHERIQARLEYKETKRQLNIDNVTQIAAELLNDEATVSDEPVNEDWISRFFNIIEDISDNEMQMIWGRILAGEVKRPNSYSLRTLDLVRNLTTEEANLFMKVARFAVASGRKNFLFKGKNNEISEKFNISYAEISHLIEIGLVQPGDFVNWNLKGPNLRVALTSGRTMILVERKTESSIVEIPVYLFTSSGNELMRLVTVDTPFEYLKLFAKAMMNEQVSVKHAQILEVTDTHVDHSDPLQEF